MSDTLDLAQELIRRRSVTPEDAGCQQLIAERLAPLGFEAHHLRFGEVDNLWLRRGSEGPVLAFAGHTDVVPTGAAGTVVLGPLPAGDPRRHALRARRGGHEEFHRRLRHRLRAFVRDHPDHRGSIALLITSDEEGPSVEGTVKVVEWLEARNEKIDWCLVGEPSSTARLGDVIKNGRRGSLSGHLRVRGQQGHVAYPHLADNPVHRALPALAELAGIEWDRATTTSRPPPSRSPTSMRAPGRRTSSPASWR
jgi:succinyl-diaminopimelate desuccinylase